MREWLARLRAMFRRDALRDRLDEELALHAELLAEELARTGSASTPSRELGPASFRDDYYERAGLPWIDHLWADVRYAVRGIRRAPSFAAIVILTLALGIGLTTAIFSVVDGVLLEPLPYPDADRLVWLGESSGSANGISVTPGNLAWWQLENRSFEALAGFQFARMTLSGTGDARQTTARAVTAGYLDLLGVRPLVGRLLLADDARPGASHAVVLNHRFWTSAFGGDPRVVGRSLTLDGEAYTVVGVTTPVWEDRPADIYVPLALGEATGANRSRHGSIRALGKLGPGTTLDAARADLDSLMRRLAAVDPGPEDEHRSFGRPLTEQMTGGARQTLVVLMGAAWLVLLIACANIASLLLARGATRAGEFAVRAAIGAGRGRLVRQLLTENLVLACTGGLAGVALAYIACHAIVAAAPPDLPRLAEVRVSQTVLLFALAVTLLTGLAVGVAPIIAAGRLDLTTALRNGTRAVGRGGERQATRRALVVAEIALTLMLTFGSALLLRSLMAAQRIDPGLDLRGVLSLTLLLPRQAYASSDAIAAFYGELIADLRGLPGVAAVTAGACPPGSGGCTDWFYSIEGRPPPPRDDVPIALFNAVAPGYFAAMGVPLRQGREFGDADRAGGARVAIVNETFAKRWWPDEAGVGRRIKVGGPYVEGPVLEIVGVAADVRQGGLDVAPLPEIYQALAQSPSSGLAILVRSAGDAAPLVPAIRERVSAHDRMLPIQSLQPLARGFERGLARRRFTTALLAGFAALAVLLAGVGIYGLLSYWVSVRQREIAIRTALGASPDVILRWTGAQAINLALVGIGLGGVGSWIGARALESLVFGTPAQSPATLAAAASGVMALAAVAAALPARRAARVEAAQQLQQ